MRFLFVHFLFFFWSEGLRSVSEQTPELSKRAFVLEWEDSSHVTSVASFIQVETVSGFW